MKTLKEEFFHICEREGLKKIDIVNAYNKKYNQDMQPTNFYKSINNNVTKYNMLCNILDSIGYTIEIKKKL